uniref:Neural cell adhesion molecule L1-like protein n=1 Tax=Salarias fasciatus TaxID=181472 RepID=A0A672ITY7_SALFA
MRLEGSLQLVLLLALTWRATGLRIPLEVEQPPTIVNHTLGPIIALPFDNTITVRCQAIGNPPPEYRWTKDGQAFFPSNSSKIRPDQKNGTFVLHKKDLFQFQGKYKCFASNKLGTSMTEEIEILVPSIPKFPKETLNPFVVKEGEPIILKCNPPEGVAPRQIYWMSLDLQHIEQDERVSMGTDGNLYFSNALQKDSRPDYCCFAAFPTIRTIVQKTAMAVVVQSSEAPPVRIPSLLLPSGVQTLKVFLKGEAVQLECIPEGYPTPNVTWMKMGGNMMGRVKLSNFQRLLSIPAVEERDQGKYMCTAENSAGKAVHYFDVIVEEPPKWLTEPPRSQLTVSGSDVHIKCSVSGKPPPVITWRRNGEIMRGERVLEDTVVLHNVRPEDSSVYQCEASNVHGSLLANVNILVINMAPLILTRDYQEYAVVLGEDVHMNCSVFSSPPSSISCSYCNILKHFSTILFILRYFVDDDMLQILNVNLSDQGVYTCIARTSLDEDAATALLTVLDVPDAPTNLEISENGNPRNISLSWIPGSDHNSSVTEFVVEYEESKWEPGRWKELQKVVGNQATAELALHGHLNYQFRVYAVNAVGPGPPSEPTRRHETPPAPPERNPENVKIQGHLPYQMDISWEPLLPIEHNGPGLEYKVSYRKLGVEDEWREHMVKRHSFVVRNTSTFVPYEIKIQSRNSDGWGPEPKVVTGYSGEDVPTAAPRDIAVEVINTTILRVSWTQVPYATVRGHLGGYYVHWVRGKSLLNPNKVLDEHHAMSFPGKRSHAIVPGLEPFSEYKLTVNVFNNKGNGPKSDPVTFSTPEGVPQQVPILTASDPHKDSIRLVWGPPLEANGVLSGYHLQYHLINETSLEVLHSQEVNISGPDTTQWQLWGLKEGSLYRFHLSACTQAGCGPAQAEESRTVTAEGGLSKSLQICSYVIDGLEPGTAYTVRLMVKSLLDNASVFEEVIQTRATGESRGSDFSTQRWFIGTMCAVALLTLIALMACFVRKNKGGKYAVKEKEDLHPDLESQEMNDDTFNEYSDSDEKPLKGSSQCSLNGDDTAGDSVSRDSLVDYADGGGEFNEDGSFIGEYSGRKQRGSVSEPSGPGPVRA